MLGHRQVTDAYLVSLVRSHAGSLLATFDKALATDAPADVFLIRGDQELSSTQEA